MILNKCKNCKFEWDGDHDKGAHDCWEVKGARYVKSETENARLRNALHRILNMGGYWVPHQVIAKEALEKDDE